MLQLLSMGGDMIDDIIKDMKDASLRVAKTAQDNYYVVCNLFESGSPDGVGHTKTRNVFEE